MILRNILSRKISTTQKCGRSTTPETSAITYHASQYVSFTFQILFLPTYPTSRPESVRERRIPQRCCTGPDSGRDARPELTSPINAGQVGLTENPLRNSLGRRRAGIKNRCRTNILTGRKGPRCITLWAHLQLGWARDPRGRPCALYTRWDIDHWRCTHGAQVSWLARARARARHARCLYKFRRVSHIGWAIALAKGRSNPMAIAK